VYWQESLQELDGLIAQLLNGSIVGQRPFKS
jgi:hypothetical protein